MSGMPRADPLAYSSVLMSGIAKRQIDNAMDLVTAVQPPWTEVQRESFLEKMMDDALAKGMTGVHDAMCAKEDYEFYQR